MPDRRHHQFFLNFSRNSIRLSSGTKMKVSSFCGLGVTQTTAANAQSRQQCASPPDVRNDGTSAGRNYEVFDNLHLID
jgi:hypothetical protein